jgi:filamentous hemagglutinin family protein
MNQGRFRLVFSKILGILVPREEIATAQGKTAGGETRALAATAHRGGPGFTLRSLAVALACTCAPAFANPTAPSVAHGSASFQTSGNTLTVTNSPNAIINWGQFNIGRDEVTRFVQQSASSAVLNRVVGQDPSRILGQLQSNGRVFLINPNGIVFGQGSRIDTAGLIASTLNLSDADFLAGRLNFTGTGLEGRLRNDGTITTPSGGFVYLIAPEVENTGLVHSPNGDVILAAGHTVEIADGLNPAMRVQYTAPDGQAVNLGQVIAEGGSIGLYAHSITQAGTLSTKSVVAEGGRILIKAKKSITLAEGSVTDASAATPLPSPQGGGAAGQGEAPTPAHGGSIIAKVEDNGQLAGTISVQGNLIARGDGSPGAGGFVETSAAKVQIGNAKVDTGGGEWLIDPADFTIAASGGNITGAALLTSLGSGDVTVLSSNSTTGGNGDINVNDAVSWVAHTLTLTAARDININAVMTVTGTSSGLVMNTATANGNDAAVARGTVKVGFNPDGTFKGRVDLSSGSSLQINNSPYTIISDLTALQNMSSGLAGNYALGSNINASSISSWTPVGDSVNNFTGSFDGLGHTISGLTITNPVSSSYVGLFGYASGASLRNIGLSNVNITSTGALTYTGALVGRLDNGTLNNTYSTGTISAISGNNIGGLAGASIGATIDSSYATGNVVVSGNGAYDLGGLVGQSTGAINTSYATGNVTASGTGITYAGGLSGYASNSAPVTNSYATGNVSAGGNSYGIGGLLGYSAASISNSYASGDVTASSTPSGSSDVGGLVGRFVGTSIANTYATGAVTGTTKVGGLVGEYSSGSALITTSYSSGKVTGTSSTGGLIGQNSSSGTVTSSFWDADSTGQATSAGGTGIHSTTGTINAYNSATYAGFDFASENPVWWMSEGNTRPFLRMEWSDTITNAHQLQLMAMNLSASYTLANNLDMAPALNAVSGQYPGMWSSQGFVPVGDFSAKFTGKFDGLGHIISGLYINRPTTEYVGLFGASSGEIRNLYLLGAQVTGKAQVGGLVGLNQGLIDHGHATVTINAAVEAPEVGARKVGGLVGENWSGTISASEASGTIFVGDSAYYVGGLVGHDYLGSISGSHANITLSVGARAQEVGGLVGHNEDSSISTSYASGTITAGDNASSVGGLVGYSWLPYSVDSAPRSFIVNEGVTTIPDVLGSITASHADVELRVGASSAYLGGLVGYNSGGGISASYATGTITTLENARDVGGLVGYHYDGSGTGLIAGSHADVALSLGAGSGYVGGLVGYNDSGFISASYATGTITAPGNAHDVGGLVGYNSALYQNSTLYQSGSISSSYAGVGLSVGADSTGIGGLVGTNDGGSISTSYATGPVTAGSGALYVGGLVGTNDGGSISASYATGPVTAGSGGAQYVGGLVGYGIYTYGGGVSSSYWDIDSTGQVSGTGEVLLPTDTPGTYDGTGIHSTTGTINAYNSATYAGFDFTSENPVWWMSEGNTRPFLRMEWSDTITNAHQLQLMAMNLSASYTLANNLDMAPALNAVSGQYPGMWGSAGFLPVGDSTTPFTGTFDGLGNTIAGLYINRPTTNDVGLFGQTYTTTSGIRNLSLTSANVTGQANVGLLAGENGHVIDQVSVAGTVNGSSYVGGLVGRNNTVAVNNTAITNSSANVTLTAGNSTSYLGGLVGYNSWGRISNSYSTGSITAGTSSWQIGGIAGWSNINYTDIANSHSGSNITVGNGSSQVGGLAGQTDGVISGSYSTGTISGGTGLYRVGGLAGTVNGSIANSYTTSNITVGVNSRYIGSLAGEGGSISYSYATGTVSAGSGSMDVGALIGRQYGNISNTYWNADNNPALPGVGLVFSGTLTNVSGLPTTQMTQASSFTGWNIGSGTWNIDASTSYPWLIANGQIPHPAPAGAAPTTCSNCIWDGGGSANHSWSLATNWTGDLLPTTASAVTIGNDFGTILFDGNDLTLASLGIGTGSTLSISSGALSVTGATSLGGKLAVSGTGAATLVGALLNGGTTGQWDVSGGALTHQSTADIATLNFTGGAITSNAALTVRDMAWTNDSGSASNKITGTGPLAISNSLNIPGRAGFNHANLYGKTLSIGNAATVNLGTGGGLSSELALFDGATVNNAGTWRMDASNVAFDINSSPDSTFSNSGTVVTGNSGYGGTFYLPFNNTGTLQVSANTVATDGLTLSRGGTNSGAMVIGAGTLLLSGGTLNNASGGTITGAGTLSVAGATVNNVNSINVAKLSLSSGSLTGTGNLTVSNNFDWTGGTLGADFNALVLTRQGNFSIGGIAATGDMTLYAQGGDLAITGGISKTAGSSATLTMKADGTVAIGNDVRISSTSGALHVVADADFDNSGAGAIMTGVGSSIDTHGGALSFVGGSSDTGYARGTYTDPAGISLLGSISTGAGNITMRGQGYTGYVLGDGILIDGATVSSSGAVSLSGVANAYHATAGCSGPCDFVAGVHLLNNATLTTGAGPLTMTGSNSYAGIRAQGITIKGSTIQSMDGGTLNLNGTSNTANVTPDTNWGVGVIDSTLQSAGNITLTGAAPLNDGGVVVGGGTLASSAGTLRVVATSGGIGLVSGQDAGGTGSNGVTVSAPALQFVASDVINSWGTLSPGGDGVVGTLDVTGNLTLGTNGTLKVDLGGTASGQSDRVAVTGNLAMDGTLSATQLSAYSPVTPDAITVITAGGTPTGRFATTSLPTNFVAGYQLASGEAVRLIYSGPGYNAFTNQAGGMTWTTQGNWSTGLLPSTGQTAVLKTTNTVLYDSGANSIQGLTITPGSTLAVRGGSLAVAGTTTLDGTLNLLGGAYDNGAALNIAGTANLTGGIFSGVGSINILNGGTLNAGSGVTWTASGPMGNSGTLSLANMTLTNLITNTGIFRSGGGLIFTQLFTNQGTFTANAGNTTFNNGFTQGGSASSLGGGGKITGNVVIDGGSLNPGFSPGHLTITGNLSLGASSVTQVEIGGTGQGTSYDWIDVTGTAALGGTLNISHVNGYAPTTTTTYSGALTAGTISGTFATITTPAQSNYLVGYNLASAPNSVDLTAQVSNTAPPPTPSPVIVAITQSYVGVETPSGLTSLSAYDSPTGFAGSSGGATGTPGTAFGANGAPATATLAAGGRAAADGPPASDQLPLYVLVTPSLMDPGMTPSPEVMDTLRLLFNQFTQDANRQEVQNASRLVCH